MSCTSAVVWKQALFLAPCEHRALLPLILSLPYGSFLTCIRWRVLPLRITGCDLQVFSLSSELQLLWSPWSLTIVSSPGSHPGSASVSPPLLPGNSAKAINRARVRAHRVCFLSLKGYCSPLPRVPVAWCFRYGIKFWFGGGVNLPDFSTQRFVRGIHLCYACIACSLFWSSSIHSHGDGHSGGFLYWLLWIKLLWTFFWCT